MQIIESKSKYPKTYHNMVRDIMNAKGEQRWRLAAAAYLHLNQRDPVDGMKAREACARIIRENQRTKEALRLSGNLYSSTDDGSIREGLNMPVGMLAYIELFDPEVLATKGNLHKLMKVFPEFTTVSRI